MCNYLTKDQKRSDLAEVWNKYAARNGVIEPEVPVGYAKPPRPDSF